MNRKILDKEAIAIVFGFKKFFNIFLERQLQLFDKDNYNYLTKTIILRTDNKVLQLILGPRKGIPVTVDNRLQRYAYYLSGFRYSIEHVKSKLNENFDALSRLTIENKADDIFLLELEPNFVLVNFFEEGKKALDHKMLSEMSKKDETIRKIIEYVLREWPHVKDLSEAGKCYFRERM